MNEIEYIKKNANKADTILRKLAFPNTSRSFAEIDDVEFVTVFEPDARYMAICEEDKIIVNIHHFNCWNKKYCDKKLIEVLMHEFIHRFLGIWFGDKTYVRGFSGDSSPIFILFVMWFNSRLREHRIELNSDTASPFVKMFYEKEWDIIFNGNFVTLFRECLDIADRFNKTIQEFNEDLLNLNEKIYVVANFRFDDTQGDADAFYSGIYSFKDGNLSIVANLKHYDSPTSLRAFLEGMVDCLLIDIDNRFIFDEESCSLDYSFKCVDVEEDK